MNILYMLKSQTDTICLSFIFRSEKHMIVFDGGFASEADNLYQTLKSLGGVVDMWFFTHAHDDHFCAFNKLMKTHSSDILVKRLCFAFPSQALMRERGIDEKMIGILKEFEDTVRGMDCVTPRRGDVFPFDSFSVTVVNDADFGESDNFINDTSVVYRLESGGKRVVFLGDLGFLGGQKLLAAAAEEELRAEYVQMAHHGQNGVGREVYAAIRPSYCLWTTPTWLWDNMGPEGYDTGHYKTVVVRGWMSEMGIKKHYVDKDGPFEIAF